MFCRLYYDWFVIRRWTTRWLRLRRTRAARPPLFGQEVLGPSAAAVEPFQRAPLSCLPLLDIYHLKEQMESPHESVATETSASPPWTSRLSDAVLTRGMPRDARSLLEDARAFEADRRADARVSFIHPVVIELSPDGPKYSAFTRDISSLGIGLLHGAPLQPQRVTIETRRLNDQVIRLHVELLWCVPVGAGWYFSGGIFRRRA